MRYYINAFKKYGVCRGRASRKEYWMFVLFHYIIACILSFLDGFLGLIPTGSVPGEEMGTLATIYILITILPSICILVRRLHDVDKNGCWWMGAFVPFVSIYVFILILQKGSPILNEYGHPPADTLRLAPKALYKKASQETQADAEVKKLDNLESSFNSTIIKYCYECGFKLPDGGTFCHNCGTPIIKEDRKAECTTTDLTVANHSSTKQENTHSSSNVKRIVVHKAKSTEEVKPAASQDRPVFCRKCGSKLAVDSAFCHKCGTHTVKEQ